MADYKILSRETLARNLEAVIQRIEAARIKVDEHHIVKMVVVSKYTAIENIATLYDLGQRAFGENQVQQLEERVHALEDLPLEWHMIGRLQKNKINKLIDLDPFLLQSLDSLDLAEALDKRLEAKEKRMECLLQINSAREESKAGVAPEAAVDVYREIKERFSRIDLRGVMTIGAHTDDKATVRKSFETTRRIFDELQSEGAEICSMGMSGDFELAIECGSNMVRIGSALFAE
ncbi:YggS family pyridoxal phosphate-dependent enzyme [Nitratifractor salsuginis]|uniref:Pyridoxal phosphate homeostasis protein n=1 Tax=Nitratifractor salsuginis (strain DSM 16511 / JCM 12458 / E9I37-1) TaxID=749222 RepID=E6WZR8_NITSE|nr:YggS family pyridoxal phosphate-dependent enzyme [Nitratifractor salsuginis]ADV46709.1 alanine racemase domain protein [Nitratifractor salsuginis DSM 16511]